MGKKYPKPVSGIPDNINNFSMFGNFSGGVSIASHAEHTDLISVGTTNNINNIKQAEKLLVAEARKRTNGNQAIAVMSLGISRQALNTCLKGCKQ